MLWRSFHEDYTILLNLISILSDGKFHTTEKLEKYLGINCTVIHKHILTLRNWGISVFTIPSKGYRFLKPIELLNETLIRKQIKQGFIVVLPVINSTNQYLLDRLDTLNSGDVCISECQSMGRGRRGRQWFSPFGSNLYFSMYWSFRNRPAAIIGLSLAISIVIAMVLHDLGANKVRVKWPNDLYLLDRKLAGVLIELRNKIDGTSQIVIGSGINLESQFLREDIEQNWINLQKTGIIINRNILAIRLIKALRESLDLFEQDGFAPFHSKWKDFDNFVNRPIKLIIGDNNQEVYNGVSRGINEHGALMFEQDGVTKPWINGEISLRSI